MGIVVNKSFKQVRKSIGTKANKLLCLLEKYPQEIGLSGYKEVKWSAKQNKIYCKLTNLCDSLVEELSNLDEIEIPDYEK